MGLENNYPPYAQDGGQEWMKSDTPTAEGQDAAPSEGPGVAQVRNQGAQQPAALDAEQQAADLGAQQNVSDRQVASRQADAQHAGEQSAEAQEVNARQVIDGQVGTDQGDGVQNVQQGSSATRRFDAASTQQIPQSDSSWQAGGAREGQDWLQGSSRPSQSPQHSAAFSHQPAQDWLQSSTQQSSQVSGSLSYGSQSPQYGQGGQQGPSQGQLQYGAVPGSQADSSSQYAQTGGQQGFGTQQYGGYGSSSTQEMPQAGGSQPYGGQAPVGYPNGATQSFQTGYPGSNDSWRLDQKPYDGQSYQQQYVRQQPPQAPQQTAGSPEASKKAKKVKRQGSGKAPAFVAGIAGVVLGLVLGGGIMYGTAGNSTSINASPASSQTSTIVGSGGNVTIQATGQDVSLSEAVAAKISPSVVSVYQYQNETSSSYFFYGSSEEDSTETLYATGSGVIISEDGYIITNEHVVDGGDRFTVVIDGEEVDATLVGTDASSDIAVLKVDATGLTAMEIGDSDAVQVGEWCMTFGSPYGLDQSASAGIVSAKFRSTALESTSGVAIYANLIQTDAAINSGSSGGALVNEQGQLIGITTLTTSSGSGIGFAIPSNYAHQIAQQIIESGEAHHAYLGVSMTSVTSEIASELGLEEASGVYIDSVTQGLAASNAGLQSGDVIIKVDDNDITTAASLIMTIRTYNIGDTVTITYIRDGKEQTCECTLSSDEGQGTAGTTTENSGTNNYGGGGGSGDDNGYGGGNGGGYGDGYGGGYGDGYGGEY